MGLRDEFCEGAHDAFRTAGDDGDFAFQIGDLLEGELLVLCGGLVARSAKVLGNGALDGVHGGRCYACSCRACRDSVSVNGIPDYRFDCPCRSYRSEYFIDSCDPWASK